MDPLTHSFLGISTALLVARHGTPRGQAALAGLAAGLLPDTDVFLRNAADPLFFIEYHRHFTHSLAFSPVIAALAAGIAWLIYRVIARRRISLIPLLFPAWLAGLSHIFCDLWTSYGTRVWWPFSDARVSLDWVAVVDPLLTLPLLVLTALALTGKRNARKYAALALACVGCYLGLAIMQHHRATTAVHQWLAQSDSPSPAPVQITVKPSIANIIVWRALIRDPEGVRVMAVRCGLGASEILNSSPPHYAAFATPAEAADAFGLSADSAQASDIQRFFHFSDDWVGVHPQHPQVLGDLRYASLPDDIRPLWGIRLQPAHPEARVEWQQFTEMEPGAVKRLWGMIWK
ncbi:metal-dependent hydrolase [Verrucomicrobium spinosum]|uniref:metal-dependent hydrolase n=1 Tax=Verrucomicrobium spinosum TaxID=2736 RepID=UPI0001744411|nr:metal-dependent hydrolase [Verrucomicrobium spinosum]